MIVGAATMLAPAASKLKSVTYWPCSWRRAEVTGRLESSDIKIKRPEEVVVNPATH